MTRNGQTRRLIVGISGASGVIMAARLLRALRERPEIETITDRPKMASAKYSTGPNSNAKPETIGEAKVMISAPTIPPKKDAKSAMDMARPASPRRAMG